MKGYQDLVSYNIELDLSHSALGISTAADTERPREIEKEPEMFDVTTHVDIWLNERGAAVGATIDLGNGPIDFVRADPKTIHWGPFTVQLHHKGIADVDRITLISDLEQKVELVRVER